MRKLGLTPQALRFHRFAVGNAGPVRASSLISRRYKRMEHSPAGTVRSKSTFHHPSLALPESGKAA